MDLLDIHSEALSEFGRRVHAVGPGQWHDPTPCDDWDVRGLVGHLVYEQLWVPPLLAGQTVAQVGDRFDGDNLGSDPVGAWETAADAAHAAFAEPGALDRDVHLSYGTRSARHYLLEMVSDLVVHAWDLARGIGADEHLSPRLVELVYEHTAPQVSNLAASGLFAPPVPVPDDADPQTKLIAMYGRQPG